jgi:CRP-like cAMP-binding protein
MEMAVAAPPSQDDGSERRERLRAIELFAPLDDAALERLAARTRRLDFTAGEPIVRQGEAGDTVYVVHEGEVGVRVQVDGSIAEVATLRPGQIFGEMALLTGEPRSASCTARTEVSCYVIDRAVFEALLAQHPDIAERLAAMLAARQAALEAEREGLSAAAQARREAEQQSRLRTRIRDLLGIG